MLFYFKLKYRILNRQISDFGLAPIIAYLIIALFFVIGSNLLFEKYTFSEYAYLLIAISVISKLGDTSKIDFLKAHFPKHKVIKIRWIENMLVTLPFFSFLVYQSKYKTAFILLLITSLMVFLNFKNKFNSRIPTPFYKRPFEFTVGFRKTFPIIFLAYFLTLMGIRVDNFNLVVSSMIMITIVCMTYYSNPENLFYVWIHSKSPKEFINHKIQTALKYTLFLTLPITITLHIFFFEYAVIILSIQCLALLLVMTMLLGKYAAFPSKLNLTQALGLILAMWFPPFILFIIPYFYRESQNKLKEILK